MYSSKGSIQLHSVIAQAHFHNVDSFTLFNSYPSGRVAVITSKCTAPGSGGYYTIAYSDAVDAKMLACFTPTGRGSCNYSEKIIRYGIMNRIYLIALPWANEIAPCLTGNCILLLHTLDACIFQLVK